MNKLLNEALLLTLTLAQKKATNQLAETLEAVFFFMIFEN